MNDHSTSLESSKTQKHRRPSNASATALQDAGGPSAVNCKNESPLVRLERRAKLYEAYAAGYRQCLQHVLEWM